MPIDANAKAIAKASTDLRKCVSKNCANSEKLQQNLQMAEDLFDIVTDMQNAKGQPNIQQVRAVHKKVKDLKKKSESAQIKASDAKCALAKCEKQWQKVAEFEMRSVQGKIKTLEFMIGILAANAEKKPKVKPR